MTTVMTRRSAFVGAVTPSQDDQSFRLAFNQNYRDILAYALRRSSTADADDIAAETFTIAWRKWASAPPDAIRPWLFGIARKVLANVRRGVHRRDRLSAKITSLSSHSPPDGSYGQHADVDQVMASIPFGDQEIIRLHCWEDLSISEIAVVLNCSPNAASLRLYRAKQRLEHALSMTSGGR